MTTHRFPRTLLILAVLLALAVAGYWQLSSSDEEGVHRLDMSSERMQDMGGMAAMSDAPQLMNLAPLVKGYYDGDELFFIHTEASDRQVATMLTEMMGPQVLLVPRLAETPASLRAEVYVFQNGVEGMGPFGYQPDVFSSVPGTEGYSPLRAIHLVSWNEDAAPRELRSVEECRRPRRGVRSRSTSLVSSSTCPCWCGPADIDRRVCLPYGGLDNHVSSN